MNSSIPIKVLNLNPTFDCYDLNPDGINPWPFRSRYHFISAPDGENGHDHPFDLEVYIPLCQPGYIEEIWTHNGDGWHFDYAERKSGHAFVIPARRIHRIHELPFGPTWSHVITGPFEQEWRTYRRD